MKSGASAQAPARLSFLDTGVELYDVRWSPDGQLLAAAGSWGVKIFDEALHEVVHLQRDAAVSVAWRPDGLRLASAGGIGNGTIVIWEFDPEIQTFTQQNILSNNRERELVVAWSPNGELLASIGADHPPRLNNLLASVEFWEPNSGSLIEISNDRFQGPTRSLVWTSHSTVAIGADSCPLELSDCVIQGEAGIYFVDVISGQALDHAPIVSWDQPDAIAINSLGEIAETSLFSISLYDTSLQRTASFDGIVAKRLSWKPDGEQIAYASEAASGGILDVRTGENFRFDPTYSVSGRITGIDWKPDSEVIATVTILGVIELWDASQLTR